MRTLLICAVTLTACSPARCKDHTVFVSYTLTNGAEAANLIDVTVAVGSDAARTMTLARKTTRASGSIEVSFASYPAGKSLVFTLTARANELVLASASQTTTAMPGCTTVSLGLDGSVAHPDRSDLAIPDAASADASTADLDAVDLAEAAPDLTPLLARGESCSTSGGASCAAGLFCVDGVCCDSACAGQCQACNLSGSIGTCSTVTSGLPRGARAPCSGTATCGGTCTGASAMQCTYPPSSTVCGAACDGTCDGAGSCSSSGGGSCPNGFGCMAGGCRTSCSAPSDCQPNFTCIAPSCVRIPESDCLDGLDNNGDGKADCEDPTCTTVMCVPAVAAGNEIGLFQTPACPATDFTVGTAQHQTLNSSCGGCTCSVRTSCTIRLDLYNSSDCTPSPSPAASVSITGTNDPGQGACAATNPAALIIPKSIRTNTFSAASGTCVSGGSASETASWGTSKSFCGATRQSSTCGGSQVCVPKPPAATPMCVRVPSAAASCPAGYPNPQGTWYSAASPAQCSCGGCTKNSDGTCPTGQLSNGVLFFNGTSCGFDAGHFQNSEPTSTCLPASATRTYTDYTYSARFAGPITPATAGTCSITTNTDVAAAPSGPSTICCQ
jgi:hypothetical protein